jgi:hypothetical protein
MGACVHRPKCRADPIASPSINIIFKFPVIVTFEVLETFEIGAGVPHHAKVLQGATRGRRT